MRQQATYRIFGTVENVEIGYSKISSDEPVAVIHLSVFIKNGNIDRYKVTAYEPSLVAIAETLQRGQQICVAGRIRGDVNERGYYNYYFTAQAILIEPGSPKEQTIYDDDYPSASSKRERSAPPSGNDPKELGYGNPGHSWTPPRNAKEAAAQMTNQDEDIPF